MHRLIDAGETPAQIFKSATLTNALAMKLDKDIGTVQVGKRANLLLLRQDPTTTIDAYAGMVKVILNGQYWILLNWLRRRNRALRRRRPTRAGARSPSVAERRIGAGIRG